MHGTLGTIPATSFYVQFFPTMRCNAACTVCFNRGVSSGTDMRIHEYRLMVSRLVSAGISHMDMLGGEPTLHRGLPEMVNIGLSSGLTMSLSSNGSRVATLERICRRWPHERMMVGISVYPSTMSSALRSFIHEYRPVVKSVCMKHMFVPEEGREFLEHGGINYCLLYMDTVERHDLACSMPFFEYEKRLQELRLKYPAVSGVYCAGFVPSLHTTGRHTTTRCPAGTSKLSIMPDGSVYPCYLLARHAEFRIGNILADDLDAMLKHPALVFFRTFRGNRCGRRECHLHADCHGGCPAVSLLLCGSLDLPDPRCSVSMQEDAAAGTSGCGGCPDELLV